MHRAASDGHVDIVRLLIQNDAYLKAKDNRGMTPIHSASNPFFSNFETIKLLIVSGALVNSKDNVGQIPLNTVLSKKCPFEIVKYLLEKGANVLDREYLGVPMLNWACENGLC